MSHALLSDKWLAANKSFLINFPAPPGDKTLGANVTEISAESLTLRSSFMTKRPRWKSKVIPSMSTFSPCSVLSADANPKKPTHSSDLLALVLHGIQARDAESVVKIAHASQSEIRRQEMGPCCRPTGIIVYRGCHAKKTAPASRSTRFSLFLVAAA